MNLVCIRIEVCDNFLAVKLKDGTTIRHPLKLSAPFVESWPKGRHWEYALRLRSSIQRPTGNDANELCKYPKGEPTPPGALRNIVFVIQLTDGSIKIRVIEPEIERGLSNEFHLRFPRMLGSIDASKLVREFVAESRRPRSPEIH